MKLTWLTACPIAHRGLHDDTRPENSLAAFRAAIEIGYPIELDVHMTRESEIVVVHDENLKRVTGADVKISDCSPQLWHSLTLCGTREHIPTLQEVLDLVAGRVGLVIEIKKDACRRIGDLERILIRQLRSYDGPFVIKSFDPFVVRYMRRHAPEMTVGQLSYDFSDKKGHWILKFFMRNVRVAAFNHAQFISYGVHSLPNRAVARLRQKGLPVLCWTIRSQAEADAAAPYADNIIFEGFQPRKGTESQQSTDR